MHHIYETDALLLSGTPSKEADRQLLLYTRSFGLVHATAQGVRELKSKLRYSVQPFSLSVVNLVRGRNGWRLTNARLKKDLYHDCAPDTERLVILARVFLLLRRMVHGEEANSALFDALLGGFEFLEHAPASALAEVELVLVLRVLHHLGYIGESRQLATVLIHGPWDRVMLQAAERQRRSVLRSVNESLKASQL